MGQDTNAEQLDRLANELETLSYAVENADTCARRLRLARKLGELADKLLTLALDIREPSTPGGQNGP
ncbi:MAG: hypothetical protein NUV55_04820 [Sulfuricaulis sp.]|uniref:hypothetical protein n=1 Tax=Sulfuricaulis sp. TaxID=2003553 RepID=UPI0025D26B55|nr:hypothetical protein [Sulfuricaulis sp.]MCR4346510.1 hypothetical protein [Sulfuricaulis sp.]